MTEEGWSRLRGERHASYHHDETMISGRLGTIAIIRLVIIVALSARNGKIWASIALLPAGHSRLVSMIGIMRVLYP